MIQACASRVKLHLMVIWQRPKCRFNFPFETCTKTSLHFELIHSKDNTSKYKVQVTTKRNDSRVNNHQRFQLQGWRANCDIQIVIEPEQQREEWMVLADFINTANSDHS